MRSIRVSLSLALAALLAAGCVQTTDASIDADGLGDAFLVDGKADTYGIRDGSAETCGILKLVSEATRDSLHKDVRLDRRAVDAILKYRAGADLALGTADDARFDTLEALDDIAYVGVTAFKKLVSYAKARSLACTSLPLQLLAMADVHGQLDPVAVTNVGNVGGAAVLSTYFQNERAQNPNTIVVSAGDLFGASTPLSMYFDEEPTVKAANLLRVRMNAVGNHEFDRGLSHLKQMIELAEFPFVSANLAGVSSNMKCPGRPSSRCIDPYTLVSVLGVKVAFIGITTPETPGIVKAGAMGTITITDPVAAANSARNLARARGAKVFVAVAHLGGAASTTPGGAPTGPLFDFARGLVGFDAVVGGHTHTELNAVVNGMPVIENKSQSQTYTRISLRYDFSTRVVGERAATVVVPVGTGVTPDQKLVDLLAPYRVELSAAFDVPVATAAGIFERDGTVERMREVALGNLVADSIRLHTGSDIAFVNGGGLRAPLPSTYAPADRSLRRTSAGYATGPSYDLVLGDVFAVLPFGNAIATQTITGALLWRMLERSVDALPGAKGYFAQISGFQFKYDPARPVGSRVVSVQKSDGSPIAKNDSPLTMTTSDFIAAGGDGYTMLAAIPADTGDSMANILRAYLSGLGTATPSLSGRITALAP